MEESPGPFLVSPLPSSVDHLRAADIRWNLIGPGKARGLPQVTPSKDDRQIASQANMMTGARQKGVVGYHRGAPRFAMGPRSAPRFAMGLLCGVAFFCPAFASAQGGESGRGPAVSAPHPAPATVLPDKQAAGQPADDEIVELPADKPGPRPQRPDLSVHESRDTAEPLDRFEQLEQKNADLTQRLSDLERRLNIVANPSTAVRLTGYIDSGFFAFFQGNGSGITNYIAQPTIPGTLPDAAGRYQAFRNDPHVQRFPEFFAPCGFGDLSINPCPRAPAVGLSQVKWRFLGDPLATAINSQGQPADVRSQNNPGQSSQAVPYDYIQSGGHPTFIINEVNLTPIIKLGEGLQAVTSINFYPRSASVSVADKQDGGSVQPAGPGRLGDYLGVDLAFLEWATNFSQGHHQISIFAGRFDPNIGIEYRVRKSPDRFGVTPSLICRYTCGTPLGLKVRGRFFDEWLSIALAVQNGSSYQENFRFSEQTDKKYMKTLSGRVAIHAPYGGGIELGVSGEYGGEVDGFYDVGQAEFNPFVSQWTVDVDLHAEYHGLELRAEFLKAQADGFIGSADKPALPHLQVQGAYVELSYRLLNWLAFMGRWDYRDAIHVDYAEPFAYDDLMWRLTLGARFDINENIAFKAEFLHLQPFGRMADGLADNAAVLGPSGNFAADYITTSLVLRY